MLKLNLQYFGHLCKELTHLKRPWCWERLRAGGKGDDKGWDGWMTSPTQWTWVWVDSRSWWWTGRPGVLQSMGSQRVGHDWATELNWGELRSHKLSTTVKNKKQQHPPQLYWDKFTHYKIHPFKYTVQWLLEITEFLQPSLQSNFRIFSWASKETPCPFAVIFQP